MGTLSEAGRKQLLLVTMNEERERIDVTTPAARDLLAHGCIELAELGGEAMRRVRVTNRGRTAIAMHYSRAPGDR